MEATPKIYMHTPSLARTRDLMFATSTKLNTKVKEKNNTHDTYTVLIVGVQIPGPSQG